MTKQAEQAIGIFDSGVGGLTVAHAVTQLLPHENVIYFGDTAHLPYGDKSTAAIQSYAVKICDCLLKQGCKLILIACNSASAAAYELVKEYVGSRALVLDVIDPVIGYLAKQASFRRVGLIGTRQTVNSHIFKKKCDDLNQGLELFSLATPLLAPMIEEGWYRKTLMHSTIETYLSDPMFEGIDALVLACTHYPLIKDQISAYFKHQIEIIDSAMHTSLALKHLLHSTQLMNKQKKAGSMHFYVSDFTESFLQSAAMFFQNEIHLEHYPLWE